MTNQTPSSSTSAATTAAINRWWANSNGGSLIGNAGGAYLGWQIGSNMFGGEGRIAQFFGYITGGIMALVGAALGGIAGRMLHQPAVDGARGIGRMFTSAEASTTAPRTVLADASLPQGIRNASISIGGVVDGPPIAGLPLSAAASNARTAGHSLST